MARKSVKSKCAKLAFVRMQEQMTKFSPHQNRWTAAGKAGEGWVENLETLKLQKNEMNQGASVIK